MSLDDWRKVLVNALPARTQFSLSHAKPSQKEKIVTYGRFVVDIRPNKSEIHRVRLTVWGNLIQYQGDVSTRLADLTTSKCLWNSTIYTDGANYMCLDVKNFYLGTTMDTFEYMHIPIKLIPQEIIDQYNLLPLASDGQSTWKCKRVCMACHKQASWLTNYLRVAWPSMAIIKKKLCQGSGDM
jgi:hypothetical protein